MRKSDEIWTLELNVEDRLDDQKRHPNDTTYKRWSCHSGHKLLCNLCRTFPPPAMGGPIYHYFGHAGRADPLDGWRCCSQKRVMSRPIHFVPKISAYSWWNCQATHNHLQIEINYYPDSLLFVSAGFLPRVSSQRLN